MRHILSNHRANLSTIATWAMFSRGLEPEFSHAVQWQVASLKGPAIESDDSITDLTALLWCSIDNDDSRDLDQLSAIEPLHQGKIKVYVAIADVDALLAAVTPATRIVYLANPNNPTGTLISGAEVRRLHAGLRGDIVFVYDAAYAEYIDDPAYETGFELARDHANVIVTRTFSKIYGLAAERIGWGYGAPGIIDAVNRIRGPFNVPSAGGAGALAAIADQDWIAKCRSHNAQWRTWLAGEVASMGNAGLRAIPSAGNFIMIEFPESGPVTAEGANTALMAAGYLVRWLPGQGLGRCLRISIGTEAETRGVADAAALVEDFKSGLLGRLVAPQALHQIVEIDQPAPPLCLILRLPRYRSPAGFPEPA